MFTSITIRKLFAEGTGGKFYLASQAEELCAICGDIRKNIDITTDTDGDFLDDGEEIELVYEYSEDRK